jgi:hypothetical protein
MSLFWPPSPRTFGGSYRWLRDRHPLRLCVLRSVRVAQRRQGRQIKAGRPQGTSLNDNHPLPPTFATKSRKAVIRVQRMSREVSWRASGFSGATRNSSWPARCIARLAAIGPRACRSRATICRMESAGTEKLDIWLSHGTRNAIFSQRFSGGKYECRAARRKILSRSGQRQ